MKVSQLAPSERTLQVFVGPDPSDIVGVVYRPGALTIEIADQLKELHDNPLADLMVAEVMLLPLITSWDLEDDEGNQLPVSLEVMKTLPIEFLGRVLLEIRTDAIPDPQTPATSENGSAPEVREEGSLSGTGS